MDLETTAEIIVTDADLDALGHVNNSVYVSYLEKGRTHWYSELGLSLEEMLVRNTGTVVLKLEIVYVKEARLGETLKVKTFPVRVGTRSFVLEQIILNERGEIITEAAVTNVMFNLKTRESMAVAPEIRKAFPTG